MARQVPDPGTAGVIARPPLLFLSALLLGLASDYVLQQPFAIPGSASVHRAIGSVLILIGMTLVTAGVRNFSPAGTPVPTSQPTRELVTTGIHGWTRNPIYLGLFLFYSGIALVARSPWMLIFLLPVAVTMRYGVVAREEAYLERRFGDTYRNYKARVRRWL